jgi:uncharacterized coiled-coil protein SlyX
MDSTCLRSLRWFCLVATGCLALAGAGAAESLESLQKTVADLSRVRTENARLESDWRWQSRTLAATVEALTQRAEALESEQAALEVRGAAQKQEIDSLAATAGAARARLGEADQRLRAISDELLALRAWLPPRLSHALELPYRSLADAALAPGERLQHLTTIWARCEHFNSSITCETETLTLGDTNQARVLDVIYWGLSHAYALDRVRNLAYVGRPEKDGWTWREEPNTAASVAKLIAIFHEKADPEFVTVPVQVTDPFAAANR